MNNQRQLRNYGLVALVVLALSIGTTASGTAPQPTSGLMAVAELGNLEPESVTTDDDLLETRLAIGETLEALCSDPDCLTVATNVQDMIGTCACEGCGTSTCAEPRCLPIVDGKPKCKCTTTDNKCCAKETWWGNCVEEEYAKDCSADCSGQALYDSALLQVNPATFLTDEWSPLHENAYEDVGLHVWIAWLEVASLPADQQEAAIQTVAQRVAAYSASLHSTAD